MSRNTPPGRLVGVLHGRKAGSSLPPPDPIGLARRKFLTLSRSSAPEAWSTDGLGSRARRSWLFVLDDVPLGWQVACEPCGMHACMSTHCHTQLSSVHGGDQQSWAAPC
jgi:hypothetical protein